MSAGSALWCKIIVRAKYDYGEKIVIDAMICCGIASSIVEAKSIIQNDDNDFYVQAAKMIGRLEIGHIFSNEKTMYFIIIPNSNF